LPGLLIGPALAFPRPDVIDTRSPESWGMPRDPYVREKFTRERGEARRVARKYFVKYPSDRY
jgi:hypothetical protein